MMMWSSLSIAKKICSIVAVLVFGYALSMAVVIYQGQWSQGHLSDVSTSLFPAAQQSQAALTAYEQQTKAYEDAVTVGDPKQLEAAKGKADTALGALESILKKGGIVKELKDATQKNVNDLKSYTDTAQIVYGAMARGKTDQMDKAAQLAKQADALKAGLLTLTQKLSGDLHTEISTITQTSVRQVVISIIAFVWVVVASLFLIWMTVRIIRPLGKMTEVANRISQGDVNQTIDYRSGDEIGKLAAAFRDMLAYIKSIAGAANALSEGDLTVQVTAHSEKDLLSKNFIRATETLRRMMEETSRLTHAAKEGLLAERGNVDQFKGGYREIVQGMNETLEAIVGPINEAASVLESVAQKDLRSRMEGTYKGELAKIKDALNSAVQNLEEAMGQAAAGAQQVSSAAEQISAGSQSLSQGANEQASSLEEVSASLQEMASMSRQNSANATEARALSERTRATANLGMDSMKRLSEAIDKIKNSSDATARIIKTIDEIAFQTNLLALNAAVEAARAGEAGKGFAVVAEEVRNLAMRSADAAKNTSALIEESVKNSQNGVAINQEVQKNLVEISGQINKVSEVMVEIATASQQQCQGVDQINKAVEEMNQVVQDVAANAEESASAAEELAGQANEMQAMIKQFQLGIQTTKGNPRRTPELGPTRVNGLSATKKQSGRILPLLQTAPMARKADSRTVIPFDNDSLEVLKEF